MSHLATYLLPAMLAAVVVFHLLVILKIIPYTIVWGSRLTNDQAMYRFEALSLSINLLFLWIGLVKAGWLAEWWPPITTTIALWAMAALFTLNTLGNLVSKNRFEKLVFTPLTVILAVSCVILALN